MDNHVYHYEGPVMCYGSCLSSRWSANTIAPSKAKARSNFMYQYKSLINMSPTAKIYLPGEIVLVKD